MIICSLISSPATLSPALLVALVPSLVEGRDNTSVSMVLLMGGVLISVGGEEEHGDYNENED